MMKERPPLSPGDWLVVMPNSIDCVVCRVFDIGTFPYDCEVVKSPKKPGNVDVVWRDGAWYFHDPDDFGGYAEKYKHLAPFVALLKSGRS
jgi:hypothetical protein